MKPLGYRPERRRCVSRGNSLRRTRGPWHCRAPSPRRRGGRHRKARGTSRPRRTGFRVLLRMSLAAHHRRRQRRQRDHPPPNHRCRQKPAARSDCRQFSTPAAVESGLATDLDLDAGWAVGFDAAGGVALDAGWAAALATGLAGTSAGLTGASDAIRAAALITRRARVSTRIARGPGQGSLSGFGRHKLPVGIARGQIARKGPHVGDLGNFVGAALHNITPVVARHGNQLRHKAHGESAPCRRAIRRR